MRVRIDFSFLVFMALLFLLCSGETIVCFFTVCISHELGHLIALAATGGRPRTITLTAVGAYIDVEKCPTRSDITSLIVLLSGPMVNLAVWALLTASGNGGAAADISLAAAIFNLLPYRHLDGGAALGLLITGAVYERAAEHFLLLMKLFISGSLLVGMAFCGAALLPYFIGSVILLIADIE